MKRRNVLFSALAAPPLPMMLASCAAPLGRDGGGVARAPPDRMTVLCDAFGRDPALQKDWGYAALLEVGGKRILFDTGNDAGVLEKNAAARHVDLSRLDFVVMSHRHGDHMGGIPYLLRVNPKVKIFAPKEGFGVYGFDLPSTFYRKDDSLAAHERYYDGRPPEVMRFGKAWPEANITLVDKNIELTPGVHAVALISDKPGTLELRELSLAVSTPEGLVILVGCSHPGIDKIVQTASAIDPRVHLVAGGFHLVVAKDPEIQGVIGVLRDKLKVHYVAPGHCTGEPTFAALKSAFGDRYLYAGLGSTLTLGATPHLVGDSVRAGASLPSADDLAQYLALSAANDSRRRGLFVGLQPSATPGAAYLGRLQRTLAGCC